MSVVLEQELLLVMDLISVAINRELGWSILLLFHVVVDGATDLLSGDQVDEILSL